MIAEVEDYHYTECGLPNVWIQGIPVFDDDGEETIRIPNVNGLHRLIAEGIVGSDGSLTGAELRFLRSEMGMTQSQLGSLLHRERLTVSRWERDESAMDGSAEALLRIYATIKLGLGGVDEVNVEQISARCVSAPDARGQLRIDGSIPGCYRLVA